MSVLRRVLAAGACTVLVLSGAAPAAAHPPVRAEATSSVVLDCTTLAPDGRLVALDAMLGDPASGAVAVFATAERDDLLAITGEDFAVMYDGARVSGSGALTDPQTGDPTGQAAYDLQIERGDTEVIRQKSGDGNELRRSTAEVTTLLVTGTVTLDGTSLSVDCTGYTVEQRLFAADPDSQVGRDAGGEVSCQVVDDQGRTMFLEANSKELSAVVFDSSGQALVFADGHDDVGGLITQRSFGGRLAVFDIVAGEPAGEIDVRADVTLDRTRERTVELRPQGRLAVTTQTLDLDGEIAFTGDLVFSLDGCTGVWRDYKWEYRYPGP